jgi:putative membrane protein
MTIQQRFSVADLARIKQAVKAAESKISGEIVPVFVERSGTYSVAAFRGAILAGALAFLAIILFDRYVPALAVFDPMFIFLIVVGVSVGAFLLVRLVPGLLRLLIRQDEMDQATRHRAEVSFLREEVFNTRQRTGIMIFISFFEHEVIVMADTGISKLVEQKVWDEVVLKIIEQVKKRNMVAGIEAAIQRCGELLLEKGFVITPDDVNELSDDLRTE